MDQANRRQFLRYGTGVIASTTISIHELQAETKGVPQSVQELWADFDPRKDKLEIEVIREWKEAGGVYRHVRFLVGTFKNKAARMTAIYGYPEGAKKRPGVMHIHGGGQRAFLNEVQFLVGRGYAALSVNWGGCGTGKPPINALDGAKPDDPNTDWGTVDPTQTNVPGYNSLLPGAKQFFDEKAHPKNNNWYLLTLGCRRGLTFLEQQPEVDPDRLGVHGFSMGGNLTMYVAGTDTRVKAAVPAVGGAGYRWEKHQFGAGKPTPAMAIAGDVETFRKTLSFESYAPAIRCPVLHRSSTNDFHGWMDDVYRTNELIEKQPTRYSWAPHLNHRFIPAVAVTMPLWFDQYLNGGPELPATPRGELVLNNDERVPQLRLTPAKHPWPINRCEIYYSVDADPQARFWRSATERQVGDAFVAPLPVHATDLPLFAFANLYYQLPKPVDLNRLGGYSKPVDEVCISSLLLKATTEQLNAANIKPTVSTTTLIDDFNRGLRDWYQLNAGNLAHQETWTRKLTDPLYRGQAKAKLKLTMKMPKKNRLVFVMIENEWRSYRGPKKIYTCECQIEGKADEQTIIFECSDFVNAAGALGSWAQIDLFGICANYNLPNQPEARKPSWDGPGATFVRLEWA